MGLRAASPALSEQGFDIAASLAGDLYGGKAITDEEGDAATSQQDDGSDGSDDEAFIAVQQAASNRSRSTMQKTSKKGGGFQSMGLNPHLMRAIQRKGFSVPTPIQRKAIPLILDHQDVVGMARTGSGKTAAFVIPLIERLKAHSPKVGARAVLLSPSRELALQTLKAVKDFGRGTDLRTILLVGGDSLEDHFSQMTSNPDIIIATPGRFLHLLVEMSLDLSSVKYIVFDEADRLFEMGFASQLNEILHALPVTRQSLLFSATLPKSLVEFAKAGLKEPSLVRLDAESKISPDLESAFLSVRSNDKEGALLHLLKDVIKLPLAVRANPSNDMRSGTQQTKKRKRQETAGAPAGSPAAHSTIIFTATKHHVEYVSAFLIDNGFTVSYVYGSLDQTARKNQVDRFRSGASTVMVVTDIAARGIDIPLLANVVNYDFPSQPKVYIHRVGRTARAGRRGWAYSLIQETDVPYLLDLQLFLSRKLVEGRPAAEAKVSFSNDIVFGSIPSALLEEGVELANRTIGSSEDLQNLKSVSVKAEKQYIRSRNSASKQSAKRSKDVLSKDDYRQAHLIYGDEASAEKDTTRDHMLAIIGGYRPNETVFEIGARGQGNDTTETIQRTRAKIAARRVKHMQHHETFSDDHGAIAQNVSESVSRPIVAKAASTDSMSSGRQSSQDIDPEDDELEVTVSNSKEGNAKQAGWQDDEHFMAYHPKSVNFIEDRGYGVHTGGDSRHANFTDAARGATLDLGADENSAFAEASRPNQMRWDKKNKKYVSRANDEDGSRGSRLIRGESGHKIAASFRSGRFEAWKKSHRLDRVPRTGELESGRSADSYKTCSTKHYKHNASRAAKLPDRYRDDYHSKMKKRSSNQDGVASRGRPELRSADDVRKARAEQQKRKQKNARPARKRKT